MVAMSRVKTLLLRWYKRVSRDVTHHGASVANTQDTTVYQENELNLHIGHVNRLNGCLSNPVIVVSLGLAHCMQVSAFAFVKMLILPR